MMKIVLDKYNKIHLLKVIHLIVKTVPNGGAVILFCLLGVSAITRLDRSWDSLLYHLPFAARLGGIFSKSEYLFYDHIEALFIGGPKLAELMQGVLWRITGLVSAPNLVGLFCILLFVIISSKRLKVDFWLVTMFVFSIPLVLIHSTSSYIDLPANSFIAVSYLNFIIAYGNDRYDNKTLLFILMPLAVAANIKYHAVLTASLFFLVVTLLFVIKKQYFKIRHAFFTQSFRKFLVVIVFSVFLFGWSFILNYVRFENPFYPISSRVGPVSISGPLSISSISSESRDERFTLKGFVVSISEFYLWTHNQGSLWSIDMHVAGDSEKDPYFKMGGFFIANLVLWSSFIILGIYYTKSRKVLLNFLFLLAIFLYAGLLPGSAFLRYWMFLPLTLFLMVMWIYREHAKLLQPVFNLVLILQVFIFLFVIGQNLFVFPSKVSIPYIQELMQNLYYESADYKLQGNYMSPVCIVSEDTRKGFLYKLANPEIAIYSAISEEDCKGATALRIE